MLGTGYNLNLMNNFNLPFVWIFDIPPHPHLQFMLGLVIVMAVFDAKLFLETT